jgi:hypothetical protein
MENRENKKKSPPSSLGPVSWRGPAAPSPSARPSWPLPFSRPPPLWAQVAAQPHTPPASPERGARTVTTPPPLSLWAPPVSPPQTPLLSLLPSTPPHDLLPPLPRAAPLPAPGLPDAAARHPPVVSPGSAFWRSAARPWRLGSPARSAPASPALGAPPSSSRPRPGPGLARGFGAAAQPARPRNLTPAWRDLARGFGAVARCACPARRGGVARLSAARRSLAPALPAVAAWLACPRLGAALRPPCPPWRRGSPARDLGAARPWRLELGRGARRVPGILQARPGCWRAAMAPPRLRCGAQLRPARFARVARPRRRGVACPLASQLACGSPHDLLVVASFTRSCAQQWSAASFARSRSLFARATLKHHA